MTKFRHVPVLVSEVVSYFRVLNQCDGPIMVDATLGLGGHAQALLTEIKRLRMIGIDRDHQACEEARERLAEFSSRVEIGHGKFSDLVTIVERSRFGVKTVDGILFDLGVSSLQLDDDTRGFSMREGVDLDMRMNRVESNDAEGGEVVRDAKWVLANYSVVQLAEAFRINGERYAKKIARGIVDCRAETPVLTSNQLNSIIVRAIPKNANPLASERRVYQALRIEVNQELAELREALAQVSEVLKVKGIIVVISYHSLEDIITKRWFTKLEQSLADVELTELGLSPAASSAEQPIFKRLLKNSGAQLATQSEIQRNPRAKAARLRAYQKVA
jgi:16S rRNA (cytosine1402-N4)-methyltransferase